MIMKRILFVCLGNICRSPSGEAVFNHLIERTNSTSDYYVDSAGTSAYHTGEKADSRMRKHGVKRGYQFRSRSRAFIKDDFDRFDYIIAMDSSNYRDILKLDPISTFKDKVFMMTDFSKEYKGMDVPDPYYGGADGFEKVLDMLEEACSGLYNYITNEV